MLSENTHDVLLQEVNKHIALVGTSHNAKQTTPTM
jgi:hypothetical protein